MRHVDDGTLHAWLDAELPDADAAIVAAHLDGCARCRARLDAARAVRDQAGMLLDMVAPAVEPADFDDLRARAGLARRETASAGGTAATRAGAWRRSLLVAGWAASLVFAVAVGWMARDGMPAGQPEMIARTMERAAVVERGRDGDPGSSHVSGDEAPAVSPAGAPPSASLPRETRSQLAPATPAGDESVDALGRAGGGRGSAAPSTAAVAPAAAVPPPAGAAGAAPRVDGMALAAPAPPPPQPPAAIPMDELMTVVPETPHVDVGAARVFIGVPIPETLRSSFAGAASVIEDWEAMPRTEAAVRTGMALYGLPDEDPVETAVNAERTQVRTRYRLASGDIVVLVQQRDATAREEAPAVDAVRTVVSPAAATPLFRPADPSPREWVGVRGEMRITLQVAGTSAPAELATRLRLD
jgi:hypothetical protein